MLSFRSVRMTRVPEELMVDVAKSGYVFLKCYFVEEKSSRVKRVLVCSGKKLTRSSNGLPISKTFI